MLLAALILFSLGNRTCAADPPWPMYQANPAHTGYVPVTLDPSKFALLWSTTIHSGIALNPVTAADGKVYVSEVGYFNSGGAGLYALDAANGNLLWSTNFGSIFSVNPPSYGYGNVYIQTCDNASDTYIHAFNATTGAPVFRTPHAAQWEHYFAPTIFDGNVYVDGGEYGGMYSFNAVSGLQNWFSGVGQYDGWTPAVDTNYCYTFTGSGDIVPITGQFRIINRSSGASVYLVIDNGFQWDGYTMNEAVTLGSDNDAYAINEPGSVYPSYSASGRLLMFDLHANASQTPHIGWVLSDHYTGQVSLANGVLFVNDGGSVVALAEGTGQPLWTWTPPSGSVSDTMIVTDSHLLVGNGSATYAVNLQSHQAEWSYPVSGHLALGEGVLYAAGSDGTLTAISAPAANNTNQSPICRIGGPYTAECHGAATVIQLDGSASSDPQGKPLTFLWSSDCPGNTFDNPTNATPKLTMNATAAETCTVTLVVSDGQLTNSAQATINVVDTTPPNLIGASNKVVQCGSTWDFDPPKAWDACCGSNVTIKVVATTTNSCVSNSCVESFTRTWMATDCSGNASTCSQTVTVVDTTPPSLISASNKVVQCGSTWDFDPPVAFDTCCGSNVTLTVLATITNNCTSNSCVGSFTRTWVATDCSGNTNSCSQTVTVVDTTPPTLIAASNKVVQCGSTWDFDPPVAFDSCCGSNVTVIVLGTMTNTCASNSCFGSFTRTWVATDCAGNTNTCSQTVTVMDTQPPVLSQVSASPATLWPPDHKLVPVTIAALATDSCDPAPTWWISSVTSSDPVPSNGADPDYQITGAHTLLLRAERQNANTPRTYQITLEAADASGNTTTQNVVVTVPGSNN